MAANSDAAAGAAVEVAKPAPKRAGNLVGTGDGKQEGLRGMVCGMAPLVGAPLDAIKSRMNADPKYLTGTAMQTFRGIVKTEGFLALYRGLLPPLFGSTIFRSVQFTSYAFMYGALKDSDLSKSTVPGTGMQWRVPVSGVFASTCRAIIETPLEFVKVRKQLGLPWMLAPTVSQALKNPMAELKHSYNGLTVTWLRTVGLMTNFFMMVDYLEREHQDWIGIPIIGPFLKGGVCATLSWVLVWPFENLKNQVQAGTVGNVKEGAGLGERVRDILKNRGGVLGLYRGIGPGLARSLVANGSSMVVFNFCQECARNMG